MNKLFKWGVLGPGRIARRFVEGLKSLDNAEVAAVASRSLERANLFADEFGISKRYGSYLELASDPDIDAVYVATPHPFHSDQTSLCIEHGKPVLCEKPFTVNAQQARQVINLANERKVFVMEAMWTRFLPIYATIRDLIQKGAIGDVRMLKADFGYRRLWTPEDRHVNPDLGGGALLDIGVYTISFASMIYKAPPVKIQGIAHIGAEGVDEQASVLLGYADGQIANLSFAHATSIPNDAWIFGTEGSIHIPDYWHATKARLNTAGGRTEDINVPFESTGYQYEATEVMKCIAEGKLQSDIMGLDESLEIMETMDALRAQWSLKYPLERV